MRQEQQLHRVIAGLYEAAVSPDGWNTAIDGYRQLLGGAGAGLFVTDQAQRIVSWRGVGKEPDGREYGERIHAIDPRVRWAKSASPGTVGWDYRFTTDRDMDRHEFYDWIERKSGVRYFIGARYPLDDGTTLYAAVNRSAKQGHVDEMDVSRFELLGPHIRHAVVLSGQLTATQKRASLFDLLDRSGAKGLILLSDKGQVSETNAEAERILTDDDGLTVADGNLKASKAADARRLNGLISSVIAAPWEGGGVMSLTRPSGALSYMLRVMPWPLHLDGAKNTIAAAIVVTDPEHDVGPSSHTDLRASLGLSKREAELAVLLREGKTLTQAAETMAISSNTARVHLAHIFEKTGAPNQGALLRLLMSII